MDLDQTLPRLAEAIIAADAAGKSRLAPVRQRLPRLISHLRRASQIKSALDCWGQSLNVDENSHQQIVDPAVLRMLESQAGVGMTRNVVHAGIQHTYGYLLSISPTPYGFKRTRWLQPTIELAFGFPKGSLQAFPSRGTLIGNLTDLLSRIALRDQLTPSWEGPRPIRDHWQPNRFRGMRIVETVQVSRQPTSSDSTSCQEVAVRTDLVPFAFAVPDCVDRFLLVYSVSIDEQPARLITTFPVGEQTQQSLVGQPEGSNETIRLRFNGHVPNWTSREQLGTRSICEWSLC